MKLNWKYWLYVLGLAAITWYLSTVLNIRNPTVLLPSVTVFGAILSIFLAFRTNEAYSRWWEARTLWGGLVNYSRSFTRELLSFLNDDNLQEPEQKDATLKRMVYRHLAYINALRLHLRGEENYNEVLRSYLSAEEMEGLIPKSNKPTQIIANQSIDLNSSFREDHLNSFEYIQLNKTLNEFYNIQGGCERIKNTVFPRLYAYYTTSLTWVFSFLLIVSLVDEFEWQTMLVRVIVAYVFLVLDELGRRLKNPFENDIDDTPMTSLCRTIEIDLREMINDPHDLEPQEPNEGVLD